MLAALGCDDASLVDSQLSRHRAFRADDAPSRREPVRRLKSRRPTAAATWRSSSSSRPSSDGRRSDRPRRAAARHVRISSRSADARGGDRVCRRRIRARAVNLAGIKFLRTWNIWPNEPGLRAWPLRLAVAATYLPLLILGLWGAVGSRGAAGRMCSAGLPAPYFALLHMIFVGSIRYREPAMIALIPLAAGVIERVAGSGNSLTAADSSFRLRARGYESASAVAVAPAYRSPHLRPLPPTSSSPS